MGVGKPILPLHFEPALLMSLCQEVAAFSISIEWMVLSLFLAFYYVKKKKTKLFPVLPSFLETADD